MLRSGVTSNPKLLICFYFLVELYFSSDNLFDV